MEQGAGARGEGVREMFGCWVARATFNFQLLSKNKEREKKSEKRKNKLEHKTNYLS